MNASRRTSAFVVHITFEIFDVSDRSEQIANAMVYDMLDYDCLYFDIRFVGLDCKNRKIIGNAGHFLWLNL